MKATEIKNEGLDRHFKVIVPSQIITTKIGEELLKLSKTIKMAGFREGKVPLPIVQKKYHQAVKSDVISSEVRKSVEDLVKEHGLNLAESPNVDELKSEDGKDLEFLLKCELMPEITIPDFKKVKLTRPVVEVNDKDIEKQLKLVAEANKTFSTSKAKAAEGDEVTIDFVGSIEGKEFPGGAAQGHAIVLGSKTFIPGFEDQLVGKKAGDEVIVKVSFPESYHAKDLAGKASEFKVNVHEVKKPEVSKIDDELAKKSGCKDLEELKKRIADGISAGYNEQVHTILKMSLFDKLEDALKFDIPHSMGEREYQMLKSQSEKFVDDTSMEGKSKEDLDKYYRRVATRRIKIGLMLAEYVKKHDIKIDQKDMQQAIFNEARNYPGQESAVIDYYVKNQRALETLSGPILEEKAVKAIFANEVSMSDKKYSVAEIEKFIEAESERDVL